MSIFATIFGIVKEIAGIAPRVKGLWDKHRPLKVMLEWAAQDEMPDNESRLMIEAHNAGQSPVDLIEAGYIVVRRQFIQEREVGFVPLPMRPPTILRGPSSLPQTLAADDRCRIGIPAAELSRVLRSLHYEGTVTLRGYCSWEAASVSRASYSKSWRKEQFSIGDILPSTLPADSV